MSNGFQLLLSTTTVVSVQEFLRCARTLQEIFLVGHTGNDPVQPMASVLQTALRP